MNAGNDALLEILKSDHGLRFTFLDRTRPSLSYEQILDVPDSVFEEVNFEHVGILRSISARLVRGTRSELAPEQEDISAAQKIHELSENIRRSLFPEDFLAHIRDFAPSTLLIRTNRPLIPWELSRINGDILGLKMPTGRSLLTQRPLRRLPQRIPTRQMRALIIANPTSDLPGADLEADALATLFDASPFFEYRLLRGRDATLARTSQALSAGSFDFIHYAGHSDYQKKYGEHGDLYLADGNISGQYLAKIAERNPPRLFFLNSCNSALVESAAMFFDDLLGIAPNLLRVGVDSVIGASWPVIDQSAVQIAVAFYELVGAGVPVGEALNRARSKTSTDRDIPYWLGYSLFGDPNLRLRDDDSWKVSAIRSGGRAAAASTFAGRAALHVSSLHSFLMSAEETDTCAISFACECTKSEALVYRKELDVDAVLRTRDLRVGVPGKTGSAIFVRKMLAELGVNQDRCRFVELDTAEVQVALQRDAIDITALWQPDLAALDEEEFSVRFSTGKNSYTVCVLVARNPRTAAERRAALAAAQAFRELASEYRGAPDRWARLLAEQMGLPIDQIVRALPAYDFAYAGESELTHLNHRIRNFVSDEIQFMKKNRFISPEFDALNALLPLGAPIEEKDQALLLTQSMVADIQWSISSIPLLIGRYLRYFS